ncbi:MAG: hypothetical protein OEW18_13020 [Candidatus Aminicenantes bacterium]|nr:hypothetical protein [Candidatus Aminicenantes bacterium]
MSVFRGIIHDPSNFDRAEFRAYEAEIGRTLFKKGHVLTQTTLKILEFRLAVRLARKIKEIDALV